VVDACYLRAAAVRGGLSRSLSALGAALKRRSEGPCRHGLISRFEKG